MSERKLLHVLWTAGLLAGCSSPASPTQGAAVPTPATVPSSTEGREAADRVRWATARLAGSDRIDVEVYFHCQNEEKLSTAQFNRLKRLALAGVERYWSGAYQLNGRVRWVRTRAKQRPHRAIGLDLYAVRSGAPRVSHNTGYSDASVFYNAVRYGGFTPAGDAEFALTAAHEFGHSVLHAARGREYSWGHKGTARFEWAALRFEAAADAPRYPRRGPIDLMRYYRGVPPSDVYTRTRATAEDLAELVHLALGS